MGPLGHLGSNRSAIGRATGARVTQALEIIAELSERHPGSADMFTRYLQMTLTVEQIGYCSRIGESASRYPERLLSLKPTVASRAKAIAQELVHEYKHHGFVIDFDKAQKHLGADWVRTGTLEAHFAEQLYDLFAMANLFLNAYRDRDSC